MDVVAKLTTRLVRGISGGQASWTTSFNSVQAPNLWAKQSHRQSHHSTCHSDHHNLKGVCDRSKRENLHFEALQLWTLKFCISALIMKFESTIVYLWCWIANWTRWTLADAIARHVCGVGSGHIYIDRQFPCSVSYTNLLCAFESPGVTEDQFKEGPSYSEDMGAVYAKSKL